MMPRAFTDARALRPEMTLLKLVSWWQMRNKLPLTAIESENSICGHDARSIYGRTGFAAGNDSAEIGIMVADAELE